MLLESFVLFHEFLSISITRRGERRRGRRSGVGIVIFRGLLLLAALFEGFVLTEVLSVPISLCCVGVADATVTAAAARRRVGRERVVP